MFLGGVRVTKIKSSVSHLLIVTSQAHVEMTQF